MLVLRYFEKDKRSIPLIQFSLYLSFPRLFPLQSIPQEGKQKGERRSHLSPGVLTTRVWFDLVA
jgi:hypothetical protein